MLVMVTEAIRSLHPLGSTTRTVTLSCSHDIQQRRPTPAAAGLHPTRSGTRRQTSRPPGSPVVSAATVRAASARRSRGGVGAQSTLYARSRQLPPHVSVALHGYLELQNEWPLFNNYKCKIIIFQGNSPSSLHFQWKTQKQKLTI